MTIFHETALEEERWSPVQVLLWIATRSRRFMDALEGLPISQLEERLGRLQRENHSPPVMTLANALQAFRCEVERGSLRGLAWESPRAKSGTLPVFKIHEFVRVDTSFREVDVRRAWPDWPPTLAWNAAKAVPWQPRSGIPKGWIRSLPAGDYLPFGEVVKLLAFGPIKMAIGLPQVDEQAERLRAGIAIIGAGGSCKVSFFGMPCERWETAPHLLRQRGPRILIEPEALRDLAPIPFGGHDWLGPRRYADDYAEVGHAPPSVSICEVMVERDSLIKWLNFISTQAPRLSEAEVRDLILSEKAKNVSITIGAIEQLVKAKDPLFPRDSVRKTARSLGLEGRRGRPRKSAE